MEANNKNNQLTQDIEQVVSKMGQMTPKERANHDWKLNLFKKAQQINKESSTDYQSSKQNVNPELVIKATKIIAIYAEAGVYKISDIVEDTHAKFGEFSKEMFDAIKQGYASFRETTNEETYSKLDSNTRDYTYEKLIDKLKNDEQANEHNNQVHLLHYSQVVKKFLKQHHKNFYKSLLKDNELDQVANRRATLFLEQLEMSDNPQMDKEIYFQQMLEF